MTDSRAKMMKQIQIYAFAVNEAVLYLDTHTEDKSAIAYFNKYRSLLREAIRKYETAYGPITADGVQSDCAWSWILEPWPWEYDAQ